MSDEKFYKIATEEYEKGEIDDSVMTKAITLSDGDESKAKWEYIKLRAEKLHDIENPPDDENDDEDEKEEKWGCFKTMFIVMFFPITVPYLLIRLILKKGFFFFWWSD